MQNKDPKKGQLITLAGCIEIGRFMDRSAAFFTQIPNLASKTNFQNSKKSTCVAKTSVQVCVWVFCFSSFLSFFISYVYF